MKQVWILGALAVIVFGCQNPPIGGAESKCLPGASVACLCSEGLGGTQVCDKEGKAEGLCKCTPPTTEVLHARRIVLTDETGTKSITLGFDEGDPTVSLVDKNTKNEVRLRVRPDWTGVAVVADGEPRGALGFTRGEGPALVIMDEKGATRCEVGVGTATYPDGTKKTFPESHLQLWGPDGKHVWSAP
jgi:hypothetical protein